MKNKDLRDQILTKRWLANVPVPEIQRELDFQTPNGVYFAAYRLHLPKRRMPRLKKLRTEKADEIIVKYWPDKKVPLCDIAKMIHCDLPQYVSKRAKELGLPNRRNGQQRA